MNLNKVMLVGRLTRDPEIRNTPSGQTVASISLATNHFWKDKSGQKQEKTEFHTVIAWGRTAEICGQYLTKGQEAYFEGRIETRKYTGKDGVERRTTEIIAENMQLGSKPGSGYGGSSATGNSSASNYKKPASSPVAAEASAETIPTINLDEEEEVRIEDVPF